MKRSLIVALALTAAAGSLQAQNVKFGVMGGLLMPQSDYSDADNLGWNGGAYVAFPVGPVSIRVDGMYGQTTHKDQQGVKVDGQTTLFGGNADVVYEFKTAGTIKPYVLGGVGFYDVKVKAEPVGFPSFNVDTSETKFAFNAGAGVAFNMFFVEARYVSVSTSGTSTTFFPINIGVKFGGK